MNEADKQTMDILNKLEVLIGSSADLETSIEESESIEEVLLCLEDAIDEFCETIEVIEMIRGFLLEVRDMDEEEADMDEKDGSYCCAPPELREDLIRIAEMVKEYERLATGKREQEKAAPKVNLPDEDSVAMLFYDAIHCRVFPFEHVLRICPWLNDHSVMRAVPEMKDLYYLYEENAECRTGKGEYLVGPVVVIKLNKDHFLITPDPLDRHRIRKFMKENTETVDFEKGASYEALRLV